MTNARPSRSDRRLQSKRDRFEAALYQAANQPRPLPVLQAELEARYAE